jgi:hypothetical protein
MACSDQQSAFRTAMVAHMVGEGLSEEEARAKVDGDIARGRAGFASDQERYVKDGGPPKVVGR